MTLGHDPASEAIYDVVDPEANIIVGAVVDEALEGEIHVTVYDWIRKRTPVQKQRSSAVGVVRPSRQEERMKAERGSLNCVSVKRRVSPE